MPQVGKIILWHQVVFLGMFIAHSWHVRKRTGQQVRGQNTEAMSSMIFFIVFVGSALAISYSDYSFGSFQVLSTQIVKYVGIMVLFLSVSLSAVSMLHLKDSWRIGVVKNQKTELITTGIYQFSRNPYFVAYILVLSAYTIMLQNIILLALTVWGCMIIHQMILKEEECLSALHGENYANYKKDVPRYCLK